MYRQASPAVANLDLRRTLLEGIHELEDEVERPRMSTTKTHYRIPQLQVLSVRTTDVESLRTLRLHVNIH